MTYKHTQTGYLMIFALVVVIIIFGVVLMQADYDSTIVAVMLLVLFLLVSFTSLSVMVDEKFLRIKGLQKNK